MFDRLCDCFNCFEAIPPPKPIVKRQPVRLMGGGVYFGQSVSRSSRKYVCL